MEFKYICSLLLIICFLKVIFKDVKNGRFRLDMKKIDFDNNGIKYNDLILNREMKIPNSNKLNNINNYYNDYDK
jgi:hypothetical protein